MGQIVVTGPSAQKCLERLMPIDLDLLAINQQAYSFFTTEQGTLLDDLIVTRLQADTFSLVVNGACKHEDFAHLQKHLSNCLLYTSPSPRDYAASRMPSSA